MMEPKQKYLFGLWELCFVKWRNVSDGSIGEEIIRPLDITMEKCGWWIFKSYKEVTSETFGERVRRAVEKASSF